VRLSFFYPNLPVSFDEAKNDFWLVRRADVFAVEGDGDYERMAGQDVATALFAAHLDEVAVEDFLLHAFDRDSLFEFSDGLSSPQIRLERLVVAGDVVAVRESSLRGQDQDRQKVREERDLARQIARIQRTIAIMPGRRSLLVSGADYGALPNRDAYKVVGRAQAEKMLLDVAGRSDESARAIFERAAELLAPDWRPPQGPLGMVLLLDQQRAVASRMPEPALTPSQMRAMIRAEESVSLEVVVLGLDDQPLDGIAFSIAAPDNEEYDGDLGKSAKTAITSIKKGTATVTLSWAADQADQASKDA
jgi:hypothetical protein